MKRRKTAFLIYPYYKNLNGVLDNCTGKQRHLTDIFILHHHKLGRRKQVLFELLKQEHMITAVTHHYLQMNLPFYLKCSCKMGIHITRSGEFCIKKPERKQIIKRKLTEITHFTSHSTQGKRGL